MSNALARRPEAIRAEIAADPARRELLQAATAELLTATQSFIEQYVVLPDQATASVLAVWTLHTWALAACDTTPYLLITSTEPGSGKSRLLEALSFIVRKPWASSDATPTSLFRRMDADQPTLLLDEIDTRFRGGHSNEALRGVLNSGNRRGGSVSRCDGRWGVREYATFGAKALAGLDTGFLPATVVDRSIVIPMSKTHGQVQRLRPRIAAQQAAPLAYTLEQWSLIVADELAGMEPEIPTQLSDRQADAWEPLLAISTFASPEWSEAGRTAANALPGHSSGAIESGDAEMLLPAMAEAMA